MGLMDLRWWLVTNALSHLVSKTITGMKASGHAWSTFIKESWAGPRGPACCVLAHTCCWYQEPHLDCPFQLPGWGDCSRCFWPPTALSEALYPLGSMTQPSLFPLLERQDKLGVKHGGLDAVGLGLILVPEPCAGGWANSLVLQLSVSLLNCEN